MGIKRLSKKCVKNSWIIFIMSIVFIMIFFLLKISSNYSDNLNKMDFGNNFSHGWEMSVGNSNNVEIIDVPKYKIKNDKMETITLSKKIPYVNLRNPSLMFSSSQQHVTIYLDNEKLYEFKTLKELRGNKTNGSGHVLLRLPDDCYGKTIIIEYSTSFKKVSGFIPLIYFGEVNDNILTLINYSIPKLVIAAIIFLMCIISISFAFGLYKFNKRKAQGMISLSITCFIITIWMIMQTECIYLMKNNLIINYYIEFMSAFSLPIFFNYFIYKMCNIKSDYIFKRITIFHLFLFIMLTLLQYTGIVDFFSMNKFFLYCVLGTLFTSLIVLLRNVKEYLFLKNYIIIVITTIFFIITLIYILTYLKIKIPKSMLITTFILMGFSIAYNLFNSYFNMYNSKLENLYLQNQLENQLVHYNSIYEALLHLRKYKHDMKNHLICICHLIKNEQNENAIEYIEDINALISRSDNIIDTGNPILDAIINEKKSTAIKKGIDFKTNIMIRRNIKVQSIDWCVIFGNILDNAIEGSENVLKGKKEIKVNLVSQNNMLIVKIINTMEGNLIFSNNKIMTTKINKENHGIGINNIRETVKKYEGDIDITAENNRFEFSCILYNV